jgi:aspartate aminotransferase
MSSAPLLRLSENVAGLSLSATIHIQQRSHELARQGREVWRLGLGQSPFPVPEPLVSALRAHAHQKDYLPTRGLPALQEAVARYLRRTQGLERTEQDVLIGPGSKELLFLLQVAFDGEVLIPSPSWVSYGPQARIVHRRVRWLPTSALSGWKLQPEALARACREPAPRLLVLNYPSNPTGATFEEDELRALAEVARRHRVLVLSDEIYGELRFDGRHQSIARYWPEGTIVSTGLSKWCGAGGWRLGAFVFSPELRELSDAMAAVASETYTSTSAPIQHAAVGAFEPDPLVHAYVRDCRRILSALTYRCAQLLRAAGARVELPAGGFYLFPSLEPFRARLLARGCPTAPQLCERLLEETGVACLPGSAFGREEGEMLLRLSLVDFPGGEALAELAERGELDDGLLERRCGRVIQAIERVVGWLSG